MREPCSDAPFSNSAARSVLRRRAAAGRQGLPLRWARSRTRSTHHRPRHPRRRRDDLLCGRDLGHDVDELRVEDRGNIEFTAVKPVENVARNALRVIIADTFHFGQVHMANEQLTILTLERIAAFLPTVKTLTVLPAAIRSCAFARASLAMFELNHRRGRVQPSSPPEGGFDRCRSLQAVWAQSRSRQPMPQAHRERH